jgi:hypothetical protein
MPGQFRRGLLFAGLVLLAGCDTGPKVVPVTGTLTRNGQPVPNLTVHFVPAEGRPSWGVADENGKFTLEYDTTRKGAVTGTHTVWVIWRPSTPQEEMIELGQAKGKSGKPKDMKAIEEKYGKQEKSPLKVEITKAEENLEIKLD